jgi:hypothetical protein
MGNEEVHGRFISLGKQISTFSLTFSSCFSLLWTLRSFFGPFGHCKTRVIQKNSKKPQDLKKNFTQESTVSKSSTMKFTLTAMEL